MCNPAAFSRSQTLSLTYPEKKEADAHGHLIL